MNIDYEKEIDELVEENEKYIEEVLLLLYLLSLLGESRKISKAESDKTFREIKKLTDRISSFHSNWIEKNVPFASIDGILFTLVSLGEIELPTTKSEWEFFRSRAKLSNVQKSFLATFQSELSNDLKNVSDNILRRSRQQINEILSHNLKRQMNERMFDKESLIADSVKGLKELHRNKVNHVITDSMGRKWKTDHYVRMLVETKMMDIVNNASITEGLSKGAQLARITIAPNTRDACRFHQGRIIRLDDSIDAPYPSYEELRGSGQIFHPRCRHRVQPLRDMGDLDDEEYELAERQGTLSDIAMATKSRNVEKILRENGLTEEDLV